MNINLNLYKYFYEVAKYESYTKAANSLLISQPSLSYSVKVLEDNLGFKLFYKEKNRVYLTDKGKEIYNNLEQAFNFFKNINTNNDVNMNGKIKIGVKSYYALKVLPKHISGIIKLYPELLVEFVTGEEEDFKNLLKDNKIDFCIDDHMYQGYESDKYTSSDCCIFFCKRDSKYKNLIINKNFINKYKVNMVLFNKFSSDLVNLYPTIKYIDNFTTEQVKNHVIENDEIGYTARPLIDLELAKNELIELKSEIKCPNVDMYIIYNKNNLNAKIQKIIDYFISNKY